MCSSDLIRGHARFEPGNYRDKEEVEEWKQRDPIERLRESLARNGVASQDELDRIRDRVDAEIDEDIEFAKAQEDPRPDDYRSYIVKERLS